MRKFAAIGLLVACYVALGAYAAWAFYMGSKVGDGWASLVHAWPYLLAGGLTVAVVIGLFVWLRSIPQDAATMNASAGTSRSGAILTPWPSSEPAS